VASRACGASTFPVCTNSSGDSRIEPPLASTSELEVGATATSASDVDILPSEGCRGPTPDDEMDRLAEPSFVEPASLISPPRVLEDNCPPASSLGFSWTDISGDSVESLGSSTRIETQAKIFGRTHERAKATRPRRLTNEVATSFDRPDSTTSAATVSTSSAPLAHSRIPRLTGASLESSAAVPTGSHDSAALLSPPEPDAEPEHPPSRNDSGAGVTGQSWEANDDALGDDEDERFDIRISCNSRGEAAKELECLAARISGAYDKEAETVNKQTTMAEAIERRCQHLQNLLQQSMVDDVPGQAAAPCISPAQREADIIDVADWRDVTAFDSRLSLLPARGCPRQCAKPTKRPVASEHRSTSASVGTAVAAAESAAGAPIGFAAMALVAQRLAPAVEVAAPIAVPAPLERRCPGTAPPPNIKMLEAGEGPGLLPSPRNVPILR